MPQLAERYELGAPLGTGGMARVFAAVDHRLQRQVAVKLIREELVTDETARARLLHEARAAAAFQHPNAVAVFDVGEDETGRPFIVMELIRGETLADHLARCGPLPPADAAAVVMALLDALAAAHRRGLVHRDVKPANVLLPTDGGVKLSDFGIAKGLASSAAGLTARDQIVGTPAYLSPEQAAGHPATARSDLYALGVVAYESVTGAPPFSGDDAVGVAIAHQREPVPALAEQASHTPPAVAAVVERALAKDPAERFADAAEMRTALATAAAAAGSPSRFSVPATTVAPGGTGTTGDSRHGGDRRESSDRREGSDRERIASAPTERGARSRPAFVVAVLGGVAAVVAVVSLLAWWAIAGADERQPDEPAQAGDPAEVEGALDPAEGDTRGRDDAREAGPDEDAGGVSGNRSAGADGDGAFSNLESPGELAAAIASDPPSVGEAGPDLFEGLVALVREDGADRRDDAHELLMDVGGWMRDDALDAAVGRVAVAVLEADARPESNELAEVSDLLADIAVDLSGGEERATDLADELTELLHEDDPSDRAEHAAELTADLQEWVAEGTIGRRRGERAIAALQSLAEDGDGEDGESEEDEDGASEQDEEDDTQPGRGRGRGRGQGQGP